GRPGRPARAGPLFAPDARPRLPARVRPRVATPPGLQRARARAPRAGERGGAAPGPTRPRPVAHAAAAAPARAEPGQPLLPRGDRSHARRDPRAGRRARRLPPPARPRQSRGASLAETHVLVGERGAYRLPRDLGSLEVPATVQAVLAARIDRLPPEEKLLLQTAAVIGLDVPLTLVEAVTELAADTARRTLGHLVDASFLDEARR